MAVSVEPLLTPLLRLWPLGSAFYKEDMVTVYVKGK
jgi:hypothetical protein